ncbi:HAMP domain-containing histidine kinase (plasmid) [Kovacikia minuta CCNUW1]|uniref:sensor histidine kinase n=1 Tax=Kovacikia minuta TaxID=2931930 RepID=UPI001CCE63B8|nr:HAMP domain-containing sensor histidine kinase [Kovacikia minuta]UBF29787.1 HAMP domain-containing histidine kinase [Kovacikia minuta CCNUW1]
MEEISERQVEELEHLNQLKDDFLSTVSHELRSPITKIKMATQMLKLLVQKDEGSEKAKVDHYLLILEQECDREINLLNNFLDLQQLDAGNYSVNPTPVHLQEAMPQMIQPFLQDIANQQQTLQLDIAANLSVLIVDQISLERILAELLTNACKFTPIGGTIAVRLSWNLTSTQSLKIFQLKVTNSGVDIPVSEWDRIFDRFYRVADGDRWKHGGTGLGLTLVKKLAEHLGGAIWVESGSGQTCFTVEIPVNG